MKKFRFVLLGIIIMGSSACKRCYECSRELYCATCNYDTLGNTITICSNAYSSTDEWEADLYQYSGCVRRSNGNEVKEICAKGWFGRTLLIADKEDLEFKGYTCTVK